MPELAETSVIKLTPLTSLTSNLCSTPLHLLPPAKFLGHQIYSYGQLLSITFTSETTELLPRHVTLLLQGSGITLSADLSPRPVLDHDPGLTPRHSFIVRYKDGGMGLSVCESVHMFSVFFFFSLLLNLVSLENTKVFARMCAKEWM